MKKVFKVLAVGLAVYLIYKVLEWLYYLFISLTLMM